jgi:LPS export ABC transporter protein LptC
MATPTAPRVANYSPVIWVAVAILLCGCSPNATTQVAQSPTPAPTPTKADYFIHGHGANGAPVKVQSTLKGQPVYVLKASDVYYSTSSSKGRFLNDTIYFYKGKDVRLTLGAQVADVNRITYDFVLHGQGGVTARSATGVTMTCDQMSYNGNSKLLTATGSVRAVDAQGDVLTGDKAVADLDLQQIHMSGHVGIGGH